MYDDVADFHKKVLAEGPRQLLTFNEPSWPLERFRFIEEENTEFLDAAYELDMVGAVDGLLDVIYVALGTLYLMGLTREQVQGCWDAVQKANMSKIRGTTSRGNKVDAVKPEGWRGPEQDIARMLKAGLDAPLAK